jgi:hypothetical protein
MVGDPSRTRLKKRARHKGGENKVGASLAPGGVFFCFTLVGSEVGKLEVEGNPTSLKARPKTSRNWNSGTECILLPGFPGKRPTFSLANHSLSFVSALFFNSDWALGLWTPDLRTPLDSWTLDAGLWTSDDGLQDAELGRMAHQAAICVIRVGLTRQRG